MPEKYTNDAAPADPMTPIVCQIDNAMFNSYLPDEMTFDRGGIGHRIADGQRECNFIWELRQPAKPLADS